MKQLTFYANGGVDDTLVLFVPTGEQLFPEVTPPIHPKEEAIFRGWGPDPAGEPYTSPTINVTTNMDFYAIWDGIDPTARQYAVVYRPNGGAGSEILEFIDSGSTIVLPTDPKGFVAPAGYEFGGWADSFNGGQITSIFGNKDYTLYAIWKKSSGGVTTKHKYCPLSSYGVAESIPCLVDENNIVHFKYILPHSNGGDYFLSQGLRGYYKNQPLEDCDFTNYSPPTYLLPTSDYQNYRFETNRTVSYTDMYVHPNGVVALPSANIVKDITASAPFGKQFKGWANAYNSGELPEESLDINFHKRPLWVPVFRKGDPQYTLTLKSNTPDETVQVFEKIQNEALFIDQTFVNQFDAPSGKHCVGVSKTRGGAPIYYEWIMIGSDTTLYGIYEDD